jgi:hypothetical protein
MAQLPGIRRSGRGSFSLAATIVTSVVSAVGLSSGPHVVAAKMKLPKSISPNPVFLTTNVCGVDVASDSATCNAAILKAIDNARTTEPVAAVPGNFSLSAFDALSDDQQIFAITDIERVDRKLAPIPGLTSQLDVDALNAAENQEDPSVSLPLALAGGGHATLYRSNFAEGTANGMGADYYWMYDDGLDSPNADCTQQNQSGCWAHRDNILWGYRKAEYCAAGSEVNMVMGAAEVTSGTTFAPAVAELFVNDCGALPTMDYTWSDVEHELFGVRIGFPDRQQRGRKVS